MSVGLTDKGLSNPYSTSVSGVSFEQLVGTSYLVSLLVGEIPRGVDWGTIKEVRFQHRWSGCLLDDIVVTSTDGDTERKLALQVKKDLTFSNSDPTFTRVMDDCWRTFNSSLGWEFDQETDRLGIGIGVYQSNVDKHLRPLLEWARTSKDSDEFLKKVSLPKFFSNQKRKYLEVFRNLLSKSNGTDVTDDEIWKFVRCLVVIHFDLESDGGRDSVHCWNRLLDQLEKRDEGQAKSLFNTLTSIVAEYARSAGSIDASILRAKIPSSITLKEYPNFTSDLAKLREHADRVLGSINDTIGGKVRLPRNELLDLIETSIKEREVVAVTGESMVGKSVLLKLLANRLRSEGEIIALSVERLFGTTIENFLHNIHIQTDFQNILFATGAAPLRCILIDGLERIIDDEDKRRVLNDLIIEVRKYNKSILSKGGHQDNCWKIVFACRRLEATNVLSHLETRENLADNSLKMVEVEPLSDDEVTEVVVQLPKLKELASQGHLKEILSRPLVLDILTLPDISPPSEEVPPILTETWLLDWFWKEVVRLAEGSRSGGGNPDTREQLLIRIARQSVGGDDFITVSDDMDFEAVSGLVSDRLLIRDDNHIRFAHNVYEDWTLTIQLKHHNRDIPGFLTEVDDPLRLVRAFRLHASRLLEVKQSPETWLNFLTALEGKHTLSPRWYQIALTAPLFSPLLNEILPRIQPFLFENDAALLSKFLNALRTICVQPSPLVNTLFGDLPPAELEKYLAYWTIPIWKQWTPVIQLVLQNPGVISDKVAFEFSHIAEKWMTNTEKDQLFRKEIANLSLKILNDGLLQSYKDEPRSQYIKSVLWAADCLPDQIDDFVKQKALRDRENGNRGFEELILNEGWIPLCKHLPKTAVDVLESILCEKLEPDIFGSYHHLFYDLGIKSTRWHPPTYLKGPFTGFLRLHTDESLELIHRVTNHATQCWKMREELEFGKGRIPIPQIIKLKRGDIEVWGDENVYCWYRYPSPIVAPDAVTCALMALEYWMNEQLKNGVDPQELFWKILQDTKSAAVVGVCSSVALANEKICRETVIPILENPAFWIMDVYRFTQDMMAESSVNMFSTYFSLGNDKADYKILLDLAKQPHRKLDIRSFVLPIMLLGPGDAYERLQNAIRAFPDNPPFLYEDEKKKDSLVQERIETFKIWAAQVERENYELFETGVGGQIGIQFKPPAELEEEQKEKLKPVEEQNKLYSFQGWSMNLLDKGEVGQAFTIESAMEYAQDLVRQDNPSYQPKNFLEKSEQQANAIAAFVAALIIRQWQWVEKNDYTSWCREQLLIAAKRPEPPARSHEDVSKFSMGYRRSAARALPILLLKYPKDRRTRKAIFALTLHINDEVRAYLFNGLKTLWATDQKTIWKCIGTAIKSSRKCPKPIRNCSPTEIDSRHLQSILYCLPSDIHISEIPLSNKLVDLLEELLLFTINAYIHFEKEDKWAYNDWNILFFPIIANALLWLPQNIAEPMLFDPIVTNWEKSPAMLKEFLGGFGWIEPHPELENRFIQLWLDVGDRVLASAHNNIRGYHLNNEMGDILGLLIFVSPTGIVWDVREWKPLKKMTPFISRWCDTVGHRPDCFLSLVRLLKEGGFDLVPEFGISWLYNCIRKADDHKNFFERSKIVSLLAELLYDSWSKQEPSIKQNPERFKHFVFIVDKVAEQGESIAVRLQLRLQETIYDK
jgi:energy-coupling factor transporter ATP-binding protein EcfA2